MDDVPETPGQQRGAPPPYAAVMLAAARHQQMMARAAAQNRAVVFSALQAAGITSVVVSFDGAGDSGQLETMTAYQDGVPQDLPDVPLDVAHALRGAAELAVRQETLRDGLESVCYALLDEAASGWELDEGSYGEFTFSVPDGRIALDCNARTCSIANSTFAWER